MVSVIDFSKLPQDKNYKFIAVESVAWEGKNVSVITVSSRKSSLIARVIDFVLLFLLTVPTLGAALAFPFAKEIQKSAFKGRKIVYHIRRSTLPKLDFQPQAGNKRVALGDEGRRLSIRLNQLSDLCSFENTEQRKMVRDFVESGMHFEDIIESMDGSGIEREVLLAWIEEIKAERDNPRGNPDEIDNPDEGRAGHVHRDAAKYNPLKVVTAAGGLNQREAGFPNGCTHFSVRFLEKERNVEATPKLLKDILEKENRGIVQGVNGDPLEVIRDSAFLELADAKGNPGDDSLLVLLVDGTSEAKRKHLASEIEKLALASDKLVGFVVTTGMESFGVRFNNGGTMEFFDPHGDVTQHEPTSVFVFGKADGSDKIASMIFSRAEVVIEQTGQLELFPVRRK